MVTNFGKFLRHLRIDNNIVLKDMAEILNVSPSMLSGAENGKKSIPLDWESKLIVNFRLDEKQQRELHDAIVASINQVRVETKNSSYENKELAIVFARNFDKMDETKREKLMEILKEVEEFEDDGD